MTKLQAVTLKAAIPVNGRREYAIDQEQAELMADMAQRLLHVRPKRKGDILMIPFENIVDMTPAGPPQKRSKNSELTES